MPILGILSIFVIALTVLILAYGLWSKYAGHVLYVASFILGVVGFILAIALVLLR